DGATFWYGDSDTPVPSGVVPPHFPISIVVGVRPAHLTNALEIEYRVDNGPRRILPCSVLRESFSEDSQLFHGAFPYLPSGSMVEYTPILRSLGRRIGMPLGRERGSFFSVGAPTR